MINDGARDEFIADLYGWCYHWGVILVDPLTAEPEKMAVRSLLAKVRHFLTEEFGEHAKALPLAESEADYGLFV